MAKTEKKSGPSKEVKKAIIEQNLAQLGNQIYDKEIALRVGKIADDAQMIKTATDAMMKLLKIKDAYNDILKELKII